MCIGFCYYVSLHVLADFRLCAHAPPRLPYLAEHFSIVKAQYDYDAAAEGELSVEEDQILLVFDTEEDGWLLVQDKVGGKVGYIPGNYKDVSPFLSSLTDVDRDRQLN